MSNLYTLYGAPISLYTGKVRAYLRFKQIDYKEILSTVGVYKRIIIPKTGVRFIPVLKSPDGEFLQDSAVIIDTLEGTHPERSVVPSQPKQALVSALFELWGR